jgi:16S rRNA (cytidine1402-2'-O)-methyltransferase
MTKYYEEFIRADIDKLDTIELNFKGELTIVISENKFKKKTSTNLDESDKILIRQMINKLTVKEITNLISQGKKISKKEIYNYCINLKNEN